MPRTTWFVCVAVALALCACRKPEVLPGSEFAPGASYTNFSFSSLFLSGPWSVHVVRLDRSAHDIEVHSLHAHGRALGLSTLSAVVSNASMLGTPLAGVNGDFYQRDRAYAGDPRGLQIVGGEVISAPIGGAAFWIDAAGQARGGHVQSQFAVRWPDGTSTAIGLNEDRSDVRAVLYTAAVGASTCTETNGVELVLEAASGGAWPRLAVGEGYKARVREVREGRDTAITNGAMVLSLGAGLAATMPRVQAGDVIGISTATQPDLRGVRTALSGGPVLLHEGRRQKWEALVRSTDTNYSTRSMSERHPRSAVGWDDRYVYLVQVDGRQQKLSIGMTLKELAAFMARLGCREAVNLDGGGSATIWCNGKVVNSPCDKREREIANALVVVRRHGATASR